MVGIMNGIKKVGVVGCGLMGSGIAEVCARAGADVVAWDVSEQAAEAGRARVGQSLERGIRAGKLTTEEARAAQTRLTFSGTGTLGKTVITAADRAGFVVNALLAPYLLSAVRMLEDGHASAEDIDAGMVLGCAHPMGPLTLADLIGLDTLRSIADSMYEEYKEPLYAAPPLLRRMTDAGLLGRKTGRGFFEYSQGKQAS
jgi:3-hydroxyacyl-CoA dehydrogenase